MTQSLTDLRNQIDAIDDKFMALLKERIGIVRQIGQLKEKDGNSRCFLRSGREAEMVRRVYGAFKGSDFPAQAAAVVWRQIIAASLHAESPLTVSVFAPDAEAPLYWHAREYFGEFSALKREPSAQRVIADVTEGRAQIGVLPLPYESVAENWWLHLAREGDLPKIFAHVPFVTAKSAFKKSGALAIAFVEPERTQDDFSFYMLHADADISQSKLNAAFAKAGLEASWCAPTAPHAERRLVELKGFHPPGGEAVQAFRNEAGAALREWIYLGSCATPIFTD